MGNSQSQPSSLPPTTSPAQAGLTSTAEELTRTAASSPARRTRSRTAALRSSRLSRGSDLSSPDAETMDWAPEDESQMPRRVRARLADALLSFGSSPPSSSGPAVSNRSHQPRTPAMRSVSRSRSSAPLPSADQTSSTTAASTNSQDPRSTSGLLDRITRPLPRRSRRSRDSVPTSSLFEHSASPSSIPDGQSTIDHSPSSPNHQTTNPTFNQPDMSEEQLALLSAHPTLAALFSEMATGSSPYLRLNEPASARPSTHQSSTGQHSSNLDSEARSSSHNAAPSSRSERVWPHRPADSRTSNRSSLPGRADLSRGEIRPGSSITIQAALFTNGRPNPPGSTTTSGGQTDSSGGSSSTASSSPGSSNQRRTRSASFPAGQAASPRPSTSRANADGFLSRFGQGHTQSGETFTQRGRRPDRSGRPLGAADGPTAVDIAETVNRLLRVATAATAATIVARSEGLPPPPGAGAPPGNPFESNPPHARSGFHSSRHGSATGPRNVPTTTDASTQSATAADPLQPSRPSEFGPARNSRLRNLVNRSSARMMQRSRNSLDLLADSRNSQPSLGTSSNSDSASTSGGSMVSANSNRSQGWLSSWRSQSRGAEAVGQGSTNAAQGAQSTNAVTHPDTLEGTPPTSGEAASSPSIFSRLGFPFHGRRSASSSQAAHSRVADRHQGAEMGNEASDSLFGDSMPAQPHRAARRHMDETRHAAETMSDLLRQSLAQPMPSQLQRSRSQASLRGSSLASILETPIAGSPLTGTRNHASSAGAGERDDGSDSVRFDIRDSAASIATMLDRARAGVSGESEAVQGSFEWFLNQVCRDLELALEQMDVEQERVSRIGAALGRSFGEIRDPQTPQDRLRRAIIEQTLHSGSHLPTMSGQPAVSTSSVPDTNAASERRRGDVRRAELSFFRVFCFPRANQDGVSASESPAPSPSSSVPPPGATSLSSEENFVLHPDLIPCVVVGVRSATWTEMREGQTWQSGPARPQDTTGDRESGPRLRSAGPGPWPPWARSYQATRAPGSEDVEMADASAPSAAPRTTALGARSDEDASRTGSDSGDVPPRAWRFVVYITGGFWPRSHPLLQAPSVGAAHDVMHLIDILTDMAHPELVGGSNAPPGFEPMFGTEASPLAPGNTLFEMLSMLVGGQNRPQKATKAELAKSQETKVAKGWELLGTRTGAGEEAVVSERVAGKQRDHSQDSSGLVAEGSSLVGQGLVLESTAQRCLICLEDWEDDDDVRVLSCRHAFHVDCVDRWLTQASNSCPMCRKAGVTKGANPSEGQAPASPQATQAL